MSELPDLWQDGLHQQKWNVLGHASLPPAKMQCDVLIIGTGAGGGITAELLTRAGFDVIMVEEGPLKTSRDFKQLESDAYPTLYQESAARQTADKAIQILQGRCVGGSTTVNWTSSFRTPPDTLNYWQQRLGLHDWSESVLAPYFAQVEQRLNMQVWTVEPNRNNDLLRQGAAKLGIETHAIARNVKGCWNLGSCGLGCPTNAKQSMLVTCVPTALAAGARLLVNARADRLDMHGSTVRGLWATCQLPDAAHAGTQQVYIQAKHVVISAGAINSPALLLRSDCPDPHQQLGVRTFLHPVVMSAATFESPVNGWQGAPQSIYTDHFLHTDAIDGPLGYKLEAPPIHPVIFASSMPGHGALHAHMIERFAHQHILLALMRDGFAADSPGGQVRVDAQGNAKLHYDLTPAVFDAACRALLSMAQMQLAAGAQEVLPVHAQASLCTTWAQAQAHILQLPMQALLLRMVSAHVMGGCAMSAQAQHGVVRPDGTHWQVSNLSVHDGSLFPTSIGANPQLSIYGLVNALTQQLIGRLGKTPSALV